jgi:hypothetical protein
MQIRNFLFALLFGLLMMFPGSPSMALSIVTPPPLQVTFVNSTDQPVDFYVVDILDGSIKPYSSIGANSSVQIDSWEGQVWVFGRNQSEIARYETTANAGQTFTIGPNGGTASLTGGGLGTSGGDPMQEPRSISGPPLADGFAWTYGRYLDDYTNYGPTAALLLAVPETDNARFGASCSRGSGGTIEMSIAAAVNPANAGAQVAVTFASQNQRFFLNGNILAPSSEEAFYGYVFQLGSQEPVWNLLRGSTQVRYATQGGQSLNLPTTGIAGPLDAFLRDCATFRSETADPTQAAQLEPFCGNQGIRRSIGGEPLTLRIINNTGEYRALSWVGGDGMFVQVSQLNNGEYLEVQTSTGHIWDFTDGPGNCIEAFRPRPGQTSYTMTRQSPGFGPE